MYAVIKTGGKQYRVKAGDMLVVEKLDGEAGAEVAFDQVLMLGDMPGEGGADVVVGAPVVEGAVVNATLVETRKGEKIKVFKKIRRQGYRRTQGHRQIETVLRVTGVVGGGKTETWDGVVDLTTRAVLNARARGLKLPEPAVAAAPVEEDAPAPAKKAAVKKPAAKKAAKAEGDDA
jgi:large subunit ribosomal protein L21